MRRTLGPGERRLVPLLAAAAGIGILGVVALWLPLGPTTSGPEPTDPPPELAAPDTTTSVPPPATPPPATSTTVATAAPRATTAFPPPHPPEPVRIETVLGPMVWEVRPVPAQTATESSYITASGVRPDGTIVVLGVDERDIWMIESTTGERWVEREVRGFAPGHHPWQVSRVGDSLMALTLGSAGDGPAVWVEGPPGVWEPLAVEVPEPPAHWLRPQWDNPLLVPTPDGADLFGGYRGWAIRWPALVGVPDVPGRYWTWEGGESCGPACLEGGKVVTRDESPTSSTRSETRYSADVRADGTLLTVRVADPAAGETVAEATVETVHAGAIVEALGRQHHDAVEAPLTSLRWHRGDGGGFALAPSGALPGTGAPIDRQVVHAGGRYLAVETRWDQATFEPDSRLWVSSDAVAWEDATTRIGEDLGEVFGLTARDGTILAVGRRQERYQIAEQVSATGVGTVVFLSSEPGRWRSVPFGRPGLTTLFEVSAGPAGWAATGQECDVECRQAVWVSGDGEQWSLVDLPAIRGRPDYGTAIVGDGVIVWPAFDSVSGEQVMWVGRLEG